MYRTKLIKDGGIRRRAHRVIMERQIGRPLRDDEDVHHINHDPLDNRVENLQLMSRDEHIKLHAKEKQIYSDNKVCEVCRNNYKPNPRKRKRQKTCSKECAQHMRVTASIEARKRQQK